MNQAEKIKLHQATEAAMLHYRNWTLAKLMRSPASLHVMMQELQAAGRVKLLEQDPADAKIHRSYMSR